MKNKKELNNKIYDLKKILKEIKEKDKMLDTEIEKTIGKQLICTKCLYGGGENYPDEKLDCPLSNYCMYYNGDLTLNELLKKEIKQKGE